jgi:hypothetical protein
MGGILTPSWPFETDEGRRLHPGISIAGRCGMGRIGCEAVGDARWGGRFVRFIQPKEQSRRWTAKAESD